MEQIKFYFAILIFALVSSLALLKLLRKLAIRVNLVDKPSTRKVHANPVPIAGGLAIVLSAGLALMVSLEFWNSINTYYVLIIGSAILLIMGLIDDKRNISTVLKLVIQIALAHFVFDSGVRIDSMFGMFGIYTLPFTLQYILTLLVVVGVVNAFNLMDGIDGLAGGLSIIGFLAYSYLAFISGRILLAALFIAIIGALIGFLKFNLSIKNKVFMGDAGSLVLGYILVVSGIMLIQNAQYTENIATVLAIVIGVLALPVVDSLRVYYRRIKLGGSPLKADKTHFHHLVLKFGVSHKKASTLIILFAICIIAMSIIIGTLFNVTFIVPSFLILFIPVYAVLEINNEIKIWRKKVKTLEDFNVSTGHSQNK